VSVLVHRTTIRVRYSETDPMRIVHNSKYYEYFEIARTEMLRACGTSYDEMEKAGFTLPLIASHAEFKQPAMYDQLLTVESRIDELPAATLKINYRVTDNDGNLLTIGYTVHAFFNTHMQRAVRPPAFFVKIISNRD